MLRKERNSKSNQIKCKSVSSCAMRMQMWIQAIMNDMNTKHDECESESESESESE